MTTSQPDINWALLPAEARTELAAAYERVIRLIDEIGERDPQAALMASNQLSKLTGAWYEAQAPRRAGFANAIREREQLSLAELAVRLDVSKALAARWVDQAKAAATPAS